MWNKFLLIGLGGALGSICRYAMANSVYYFFNKSFPLGTLVVNIVGCFIMGMLFIILLEHLGELASSLRALLLVGFLGGFTTFSSFSIETFNLFENGDISRAMLNIALSVVLCLLATWAGVLLGRQL